MKSILKPKAIPKNGVIAISSPSSTVDEKRLNKGIGYLEDLGYKVEVGPSCYKSNYYTSTTDEEKVSELMAFFSNPNIDAIICSRGGYGTMRLLPLLDYKTIAHSRKLFSGFSDLTALEWAVFAKTGLITFSGAMVAADFGLDEPNFDAIAQFWDLAQTGHIDIQLEPTESVDTKMPLNNQMTLLPGTLSVFAKIIGSEFFPDLDNSLLVIEDIGEPSRKIDGYVSQLWLSNLAKNLSGIVLGDFKGLEEADGYKIPEKEWIKRVFGNLKKPIFGRTNYGHNADKCTLPLGASVQLTKIEGHTHLQTIEPVVEK